MLRTLRNLFTRTIPSTSTSTVLATLALMDKHYVIATKKPGYSPDYKPFIERWAPAMLILQATPQIANPEWRRVNSVMTNDYMGIQPISFDTAELYRALKIIHDDVASKCP